MPTFQGVEPNLWTDGEWVIAYMFGSFYLMAPNAEVYGGFRWWEQALVQAKYLAQ